MRRLQFAGVRIPLPAPLLFEVRPQRALRRFGHRAVRTGRQGMFLGPRLRAAEGLRRVGDDARAPVAHLQSRLKNTSSWAKLLSRPGPHAPERRIKDEGPRIHSRTEATKRTARVSPLHPFFLLHPSSFIILLHRHKNPTLQPESLQLGKRHAHYRLTIIGESINDSVPSTKKLFDANDIAGLLELARFQDQQGAAIST